MNNGDSHFEDMFVSIKDAGDMGASSETQPVKSHNPDLRNYADNLSIQDDYIN